MFELVLGGGRWLLATKRDERGPVSPRARMPLQRWVPLSRPRIGPRTWDGGQASFEGRPDTRWSGRAPPRQQRGQSRFRPADCIRTEEITLDIASPIQGGKSHRRSERVSQAHPE